MFYSGLTRIRPGATWDDPGGGGIIKFSETRAFKWHKIVQVVVNLWKKVLLREGCPPYQKRLVKTFQSFMICDSPTVPLLKSILGTFFCIWTSSQQQCILHMFCVGNGKSFCLVLSSNSLFYFRKVGLDWKSPSPFISFH